MKVSLWACGHRLPTDDRATTCPGFRYVELGQDPGPCGHVSLLTSFSVTREKTCNEPMENLGDFEMETA